MARHVPECPSCGGPDYVPHEPDECAQRVRAERDRLRADLQASRAEADEARESCERMRREALIEAAVILRATPVLRTMPPGEVREFLASILRHMPKHSPPLRWGCFAEGDDEKRPTQTDSSAAASSARTFDVCLFIPPSRGGTTGTRRRGQELRCDRVRCAAMENSVSHRQATQEEGLPMTDAEVREVEDLTRGRR